MVKRLDAGYEGWSHQLKLSLDADAGVGHKKLETRLLHEVFRNGTKSDVQRLLLRHFVEHPPEITWMRSRWCRRLGKEWPEVGTVEAPQEAPLAEGGGV